MVFNGSCLILEFLRKSNCYNQLRWVSSCKAAAKSMGNRNVGPWDAAARETYIAFIEQYRTSISLDDEPQAKDFHRVRGRATPAFLFSPQ